MHLDEAGREAKSELGVFGEDFLIYAPVILKHEGIVGVGNNQDVIDPIEHEVNEGGVFQRHFLFFTYGQGVGR